MEHATRLGRRVKAYRLAKGLSAAVLANRAGITENAVRKIESCDSKEPRFSTGVRIAAALGIEPGELLEQRSFSTEAPPALTEVLRCIRERRAELRELGVVHASVFGSVARGHASAGSDVDVIIEPARNKRFTLFDLAATQQKLEALLRARVDVGTVIMLRRSPAGRAALAEAVRAF